MKTNSVNRRIAATSPSSRQRVVPKMISAEFARKRGIAAGIAGFPEVIKYFGKRAALMREASLQDYCSSYQPHYETYGENGRIRYLSYRSTLGGIFSVVVTIDSDIQRVDLFKQAGRRLISHVFGGTYTEAFRSVLKERLQIDEPATPISLHGDAAKREKEAQLKWASAMSAQYDADPEKLLRDAEGTQAVSKPKQYPKAKKEMFYGELPGRNGALVFIPAPQAERLRMIQTAMKAKTWGQFRRQMPGRDYAEILEILHDDWSYKNFQSYVTEQRQEQVTLTRRELWEEYKKLCTYQRPPLDEDKFSPEDVPGFCDGDWPPWPQQCMLHWLPREAVQYGTRDSTVLNGDFLEIPANVGFKVMEVLRQRGFSCVYRPDLISFVSGCGWPDSDDDEI